MMKFLRNNDQMDNVIFLILSSFVLLYFYKLGFPSIWNPNEAFYAETPREMLERKDLLTPYFNYEYRFQKPVLMYWLVSLSYILFGYKEFAVRLVPAIAATGGVIITYLLAKTIWDSNRAALISATFLAASFEYNSVARYTYPESTLTALITLSLCLFYKGYIDNTKNKKLWYLSFYAVCGLSTMTKGPIGIILPLLIIGIFLIVTKDLREIKQFISIKGIVLYLFISMSWYILMLYKHGNEFFSVVYGENMSRFLEKKSGTSALLFYFTVLPWNFFPGSIFIVPTLVWLRKNLKIEPNTKFPLVWFLVVFCFFSLSKSKLPYYILPLFPALSILIGGWLERISDRDSRMKTLFLYLSCIILIIIIAGVLWLRSYLPDINLLMAGILFIILFISIWNIRQKIFYLSVSLFFSGMIIFYFIFLSNILPQVEKYRPYREIANIVETYDPDGESKFLHYDGSQYNLIFYLKRKIIGINTHDELIKRLKSKENAFFLLKKATYKEIALPSGRQVVWQGPFYHKSESQFMIFLLDIKDRKIHDFVIIK